MNKLKKIFGKFWSRKLGMAIVGVVVNSTAETTGIPPEYLNNITYSIIAYLVSQGYVDGEEVKKGDK